MRNLIRFALLSALVLAIARPAHAGLGSKAASEMAEFVMKKFGKKVASEGEEKLAGRIASAAAKHGDDVLSAVRKVGPKAIGLADEAGENAPRVMRLLTQHGDDAARVLGHPQGMALFARYGDEAAEIMMKHKGIAEPLIENLGQPAVKALGALGPQAGRRMAMMGDDLAAMGHTPEVMSIITRYGDPAMEFLWKNKGILAGGAALTAFLANPEPYLNGVTGLSSVVGEAAVKPAIVATGNVATEVAATAKWAVIIVLIGGGASLAWAVKSGVVGRSHVGLAVRLARKYAKRS